MKELKLLFFIILSFQNIICFSQSEISEEGLDTLNAYELESFLKKDCCADKSEFFKVKDEFLRRIECNEPVSVSMAERLLKRRYENARFFSDKEALSFVKKLMELDYNHDKHLMFKIYYLALDNYRMELTEEEKIFFLSRVFEIRENFYLELVEFQDFNRLLANNVRSFGDTTLFKNFNADVFDVPCYTIRIGDKPANVIDRRISDKLYDVQIAAYWDRCNFFSRTKNKKALADIRDAKYGLFRSFKGQPGVISELNKYLKRTQLDTIPVRDTSRKRK